MDEGKAYPRSLREGIRLLLYFILIYAIIFAFHFIIQINFNTVKKPDFKNDVHIYNIYYAITFFIIFSYINIIHNISWSKIFRFSYFPFLILLPLIPILIGYHIILSEILNIMDLFTPYTKNVNILLPDRSFDYFYSAMFTFFIFPIFEEILFRGIMLEGFLNRYKPSRAILYSSFLFALMHFGFFRFFNTFTTGLIFSYLYYKTHSLILCILAHMFVNVLADLVFILPEITGFNSYNHGLQPLWLTLAGGSLFCIGLWILVKFFNRQDSVRNKIVVKMPQEVI